MSSNLNLKEIEQRVNHAAYQDGLMELFTGGFLFIFGGAFAGNKSIAPYTVFLAFLLGPLFNHAKKRYIYPRIGYVKLRTKKEADPKGIVAATGIFIVILLAMLVIFSLTMGNAKGFNFWLGYFFPAATGIMMAIGPFWLGQNFGLIRAYVFAGLFSISGLAIPLLGIATGYEAIGLMCLLLGLLALISGAIMFTRFLRKYPVEETADGNA